MNYIVEGSTSGELNSILAAELKRENRDGLTVIQSGHYFLDIEDGYAADHLNESEGLKAAFHDLVVFTHATWSAACRAASTEGSEEKIKLMVLVNDWQFLVPRETDRRRRESQASKLREKYYQSTWTLPAWHTQAMTTFGLGPDRVFRAGEARWLFSESELRRQLAATVNRIRKQERISEQASLDTYFDEEGQPVVCVRSEEGQGYPLLFCGNTNCAGEVVELLRQLYSRHVRRFINVFPAQCKSPVEIGTELARQLFGLEGMRVVNVAVRSS